MAVYSVGGRGDIRLDKNPYGTAVHAYEQRRRLIGGPGGEATALARMAIAHGEASLADLRRATQARMASEIGDAAAHDEVQLIITMTDAETAADAATV